MPDENLLGFNERSFSQSIMCCDVSETDLISCRHAPNGPYFPDNIFYISYSNSESMTWLGNYTTMNYGVQLFLVVKILINM